MNQPIKCLIIDDESLATDVIKGYVEQVPQLSLVATCTNPMEAFQILNQQSIDLLFLDIEMPEINGIDFIKSLSQRPAIILTTAYREYAIESYEIDVVDYLLKPVSFQRFLKAINKYLNASTGNKINEIPVATTQDSGSIYVYANKKNIKVHFNEILYLESVKDYVTIHTIHKKITTKNTITSFEHLLPNSFLRIHRSFIINCGKINAFTHHDIEIGDKELPIGTSYKKVVMDRLKT